MRKVLTVGAAALFATAAGKPPTPVVPNAAITRLVEGDVDGVFALDVRRYPEAVRYLIVANEAEEQICNGGNAGNASAACARRDAISKEIESRGFCWGPDEASEGEREWMRAGARCHPDR
jgi:hypothetical protein